MRTLSFIRRLSLRRIVFLLCLIVVTYYGSTYAWSWHHLREARFALNDHNPREARRHLKTCLSTWPDSIPTHLLASRAARQDGDFLEADRQLRECQKIADGTTDEIAFEWALLQASAGNIREVEEYLNHQIQRNPDRSKLVWEAMAEGYIVNYRILDALALLEHWLRLEPENLRALELRGQAFQNGKSAANGARDFRRVLDRDPTRQATRDRLVMCLMAMGSYDEALPYLEEIAREKPGDTDVQVGVARCYNMLGRSEQARQLLEALVTEHPENGLALRTQAQFALADQRPAQAEEWLSRAVKVMPNDYQTRWLLAQSLLQQKKEAAAKVQLGIAEAMKQNAERLGDLRSRKLSEQPLDPALHYEMGILLLRSGHEELGERWLQSALKLDASHRPAHAALADYYEKRGDSKLAAEHRKQAGDGVSTPYP